MSIARYGLNSQGVFVSMTDGGFVGYQDYANLAAENAGLKAALRPSDIPSELTDAFGDTAVIEHDSTGDNQGHSVSWSWVGNQEEVIKSVLLAVDKCIETPATDAFLDEVKREATEPLEKEIESLKKQLLMSVGDIRDLIDYNPETGVLTAKVNFSGRQAGSVIGSQTWQGYYAFSLFGKKCFAHRLAWLLHYGEWPSQPIDHINGIKTDNSIRNLRLCSLSQNQFNKPTQKNNTTGVKGVYWNKRDKRYVASVQFNGKKIQCGAS